MEITNYNSTVGSSVPRLPNPLLANASEPNSLLAAEDGRLGESPDKLKEAFQDFVGQTFFTEMIKAYRTTQQPSAYFHGGRAEEIFQSQFDQVMAEELSDASSQQIADPMFELFKLGRAQ